MTTAQEPPESSRPSLATVLTTLCLTEIISWGLLYFTFPVLAPAISADTGWSSVGVSAAFAVALAISGLVGVPIGKLLDDHGPRVIMTAGSVLAAASLLIVATAPNLPVFFVGWALVGLAMAGVLYAPAFAAVTVWFPVRQLGALTAVTLVAGFASTVFAPLTALAEEHLGWRGAYLWAAVAMLVLTAPAHAIFLRRPWPARRRLSGDERIAERAADRSYISTVMRSTRFWLLALGFMIVSLGTGSALLALVPLMLERGLSPQAAAWVLGMGGVGQVSGRIFYTAVARRASLTARTVFAFGLSTACIALLVWIAGPPELLAGIWMAFGVGLGISTLLRATSVTDRWGPRSYGYLNGILGLPALVASSLSPLAGTVLAQLTGTYMSAFAVLAILALVGTVLMVASARGPGPVPITVTERS